VATNIDDVVVGAEDPVGYRDWVVRFNAEGPDGVRDHHGGGVVPRLTSTMLEALMRRIEKGPIAAVHGIVRWRQADLGRWLHEEFGVSLSRSRLSAVIWGLDFRLLTGRPRRHSRDPGPASRQGNRTLVGRRGAGRSEKKLTRRWARRCIRPGAPADQRTRSAWIFGAICPALGKGAALVLP
jgi:transposase